MKRSLKVLLAGLTLISFAACERASDTVVGVPNVTIDCNSTDHPQCSGSITPLGRVIMTRSGCENADFEPIASGTVTLTCATSGCLGTVNDWVDTNGNDVNEIISGRMDLCGLIDFNSDTQEDPGDYINTTSQDISSSATIILEVWEEV